MKCSACKEFYGNNWCPYFVDNPNVKEYKGVHYVLDRRGYVVSGYLEFTEERHKKWIDMLDEAHERVLKENKNE